MDANSLKRLLFASSILLGGCSMNGIGLSDADVVVSDGATIVTTRTYGIDVNTRARQSGISLGYSRIVQVLPRDVDGLPPGSHLFGIAVNGERIVAAHRRSFGLDMDLNQDSIGFSLGLTEWMKVVPIDSNQSVQRSLVFFPDDPALTQVNQCGGAIAC